MSDEDVQVPLEPTALQIACHQALLHPHANPSSEIYRRSWPPLLYFGHLHLHLPLSVPSFAEAAWRKAFPAKLFRGNVPK